MIVYSDPFTSFPDSLSFLCAFHYLKRQTNVYEKDSTSFVFPRLTGIKEVKHHGVEEASAGGRGVSPLQAQTEMAVREGNV